MSPTHVHGEAPTWPSPALGAFAGTTTPPNPLRGLERNTGGAEPIGLPLILLAVIGVCWAVEFWRWLRGDHD